MHAFLITGATQQERRDKINKKLEEWRVSPFDQAVLTTQQSSIGVSDVRAFQQRLQLTPAHSPYTVGIIQNAQLLTQEAQSALLKTLEEPPPHTRLILEAPTSYALLPTILSRCQILRLGESKEYTDEAVHKVLTDLTRLSQAKKIGERIQMIDELTETKEEAKVWVEQAIVASRALLFTSPNRETAQLSRRLLFAQNQLAANTNPKLVLDAVFL